MSPLGSAVMDEVRVIWERLACSFMVLSSFQSWQEPDLTCLTSVSLPLSLDSAIACICCSGRNDSITLHFSVLQRMCSITRSSLLLLLRDPHLALGEWREAVMCREFGFFLAMVAARALLPHFHVMSQLSPWVQLQHVLATQAAMLILLFIFSGLQRVHPAN